MSSNATQSVLPPNILFDDRGPGLRAILIIFIVIMVVVMSLRLWSRAITKERARRVGGFWWENRLALAALVGLKRRASVMTLLLLTDL
jgi:hypothetical protein